MRTLAASQAKNNFGHLLDMAHSGPVTIEKHGRAVAVMISLEYYEELEARENAYWIALAEEAEKEGYLGAEESERLLNKYLNAPD